MKLSVLIEDYILTNMTLTMMTKRKKKFGELIHTIKINSDFPDTYLKLNW